MFRLKTRVQLFLIVLIVLAAGCSQPSYDLTVRVTETDGAPIPQASVMLMRSQDVQLTDDDGQATWTHLEEDTAVLFVSADGHLVYSNRVELQRGHNDLVVALEREPTIPDPHNP